MRNASHYDAKKVCQRMKYVIFYKGLIFFENVYSNIELFLLWRNVFCENLIFYVGFDITRRGLLDKSLVAKTRTGNTLTSSHLWAIEPCWTLWTEENDKSLRNHCKLLDKWIVVISAGKIINTGYSRCRKIFGKKIVAF